MSRFDVAIQRAMAAELRARVGRLNRSQTWLQREADVPWGTWRRYFVDEALDADPRSVPLDAVRRLAEAVGMEASELMAVAERTVHEYLPGAVGGSAAEQESLRRAIEQKAPPKRRLRSTTERKYGRSAMGE